MTDDHFPSQTGGFPLPWIISGSVCQTFELLLSCGFSVTFIAIIVHCLRLYRNLMFNETVGR